MVWVGSIPGKMGLSSLFHHGYQGLEVFRQLIGPDVDDGQMVVEFFVLSLQVFDVLFVSVAQRSSSRSSSG